MPHNDNGNQPNQTTRPTAHEHPTMNPNTLPCVPPQKKGRHQVSHQGQRVDLHRIIWMHANRRVLTQGERLVRKCETSGCLEPSHYYLIDHYGDIAMLDEQFHQFFLRSITEPPARVELPTKALATTLRFRLYSWRKKGGSGVLPEFDGVSISIRQGGSGQWIVVGSAGDEIFEQAFAAAGMVATPAKSAVAFAQELLEEGEERP